MAIGIALFPVSWRLGPWVRPHKAIFAFGPLRFILYRKPGSWAPNKPEAF